jgi:hypothetical protein
MLYFLSSVFKVTDNAKTHSNQATEGRRPIFIAQLILFLR